MASCPVAHQYAATGLDRNSSYNLCRVEYGPDCGAFTEKDPNWKGEWREVKWPDLTPLYSLFN